MSLKSDIRTRPTIPVEIAQMQVLLSGQVVYPGFVTGRVRIVTEVSMSWRKFRKGEILVAQFISPEYSLLVHKALAVVADIGAVISHAATIIRELGIPCVVGTKHATRVLKDGDIVEIDAHRGIVRVL